MILEYDVPGVRHGKISVGKLLKMEIHQIALVRLESGAERIGMERLMEYSERVKKHLGEKSEEYVFRIGIEDSKCGLVVKKKCQKT